MMAGRLVISACLFAVAGAAAGQDLGALRQRMRTEATAGAALVPKPTQTITYGRDPEQQVDFWRAGTAAPAPLILFVHGGGWQHGNKTNALGQWKATHYPGEGYNFASTGYRLVPNARVEDQAADVAAALRALIDRADALGIDRKRIVLMGHSAGAHLVALVGTDPRYLAAVGLSLADIRGVVALDGAAYDVPRQMRDGPPLMQKTYALVFGQDQRRQQLLSPFYQAAAPNAAAFLIPHVQRPDGIVQSNALAEALNKAGTRTETVSLPGTGLQGHAEINRRMGDPSYAGTAKVDVWLKTILAR